MKSDPKTMSSASNCRRRETGRRVPRTLGIAVREGAATLRTTLRAPGEIRGNTTGEERATSLGGAIVEYGKAGIMPRPWACAIAGRRTATLARTIGRIMVAT